jgi:hypothetical protein
MNFGGCLSMPEHKQEDLLSKLITMNEVNPCCQSCYDRQMIVNEVLVMQNNNIKTLIDYVSTLAKQIQIG